MVLQGRRRGHADRRAPQLAPVARQGQDLGHGAQAVRPDRHRAEGDGLERRDRGAGGGRHRLLRRGAAAGMGETGRAPPAEWTGAIKEKVDGNIAKMAPRLQNNNVPMDFHGALGALRRIIKERPDAILVNEGANTLDFARSIIDMYQPRNASTSAPGASWGSAWARRSRRRSRPASRCSPSKATAPRVLRHGGGDDLPLQAAGLRRRLQQQRHLPRHRRQPDRRAPTSATTCSSRARATTR